MSEISLKLNLEMSEIGLRYPCYVSKIDLRYQACQDVAVENQDLYLTRYNMVHLNFQNKIKTLLPPQKSFEKPGSPLLKNNDIILFWTIS